MSIAAPWTIDEEQLDSKYVISDSDGNVVAVVYPGADQPEAKPTADLIASAPALQAQRDALAAALRKIVQHAPNFHDSHSLYYTFGTDEMALARAALALIEKEASR